MVHRLVAALLALSASTALCRAQLPQQPAAPVPLYPGAAPRSFEPEALPPIAPAKETNSPANPTPAAQLTPGPAASSAAPDGSAPGSASAGRVFCGHPVEVGVANPDSVPERFRPFVGIWSDASWTPQLCAALIVEHVTPDGTARIVYVFGPMGAAPRGKGGVPGGVLRGTGIIRDGELRFQNSDGSQFAFRPLYADLGGRLTTPQSQSYEAVFIKTP